jgi:hypothetical protein
MFLENTAPYALSPAEKESYLREQLGELLDHHSQACPHYRLLVEDWKRHANGKPLSAENFPFIPVTVFKEFVLKSTGEEVMTLRSSATTSKNASQIFVDKPTKKRQAVSASKVMADYVGTEQRPYIVFDIEETVRGTAAMGARGAAILSLAYHASKFHFVMRERNGQLEVDPDALDRALEEIGERSFVAYGFTYILYQAHQWLAQHHVALPPAHPDSLFMHSGGWKKLIDLAVDKSTFNQTVSGVWGLESHRVVDFYGAIEQVGVPYPDCSEGYKHVPYWADVVIRSADTLAALSVGETGLIQLLSCLPLSAPNHSVLTEDLGELVLLDGCPCGRRGKAFVFRGRAPKSEVRGCSDVGRN